MTATPLKLGVLLPTRALVMTDDTPKDANPVLEMALRAEAAGLDSVWVGDSLSAKPRMEPLTTLAALATCTLNGCDWGPPSCSAPSVIPCCWPRWWAPSTCSRKGAPSWP